MESEMSPKRKCPVDERERFAKLYDVIVDIFRTYTANFVWTVGLFILVNGWFLISASIRDSVPAFGGPILLACLGGLLYTSSCWMYYRRSQEKIS